MLMVGSDGRSRSVNVPCVDVAKALAMPRRARCRGREQDPHSPLAFDPELVGGPLELAHVPGECSVPVGLVTGPELLERSLDDMQPAATPTSERVNLMANRLSARRSHPGGPVRSQPLGADSAAASAASGRLQRPVRRRHFPHRAWGKTTPARRNPRPS